MQQQQQTLLELLSKAVSGAAHWLTAAGCGFAGQLPEQRADGCLSMDVKE